MQNVLIPSAHMSVDAVLDSPTTTTPPSPDSSALMLMNASRELTIVTQMLNVPILSAAGTALAMKDGMDLAILVRTLMSVLKTHAMKMLIALTTTDHSLVLASPVLLKERDSVCQEIASTLMSV